MLKDASFVICVEECSCEMVGNYPGVRGFKKVFRIAIVHGNGYFYDGIAKYVIHRNNLLHFFLGGISLNYDVV